MAGLPTGSGIIAALQNVASLGSSPAALPKRSPQDFGDTDDLFAQLREWKWRDVSFPATKFRFRLRQDLVQHKYPDRDGAHIEGVGRAPYEFSCSIPFLNGVTPGKAETFGVLYPTTFRQFLVAMADRSDGTLQHPELGLITAKPESIEVDWESGRRDGVMVEASWIESTDDPLESTAFVASSSPITTATLGSQDLDAQIVQITPPPPPDPAFQPTFATAMRALQAVSDSITMTDQSIVGKIDQLTYRAQAFNASLDQARSCLNWPVRQSIQRVIAGTLAMKGNLATQNKQIAKYVVPFDGTIGLVAMSSGSTVADLLVLNPDLAFNAVVPANTVVRIYAS